LKGTETNKQIDKRDGGTEGFGSTSRGRPDAQGVETKLVPKFRQKSVGK